MEASTQRLARPRRAMPLGVWGMTLFLCSEITIFGTLLASYFYLDFDAHRWPPAGVKLPEVAYPAAAAGWLVLTVIPMWLAARSARRGERTQVVAAIAVALLMQCGYVAAQVILFRHDLLQFSRVGGAGSTAYGSIYFTLLATHHAHVVLGLFLDMGLVWFVAWRGLTDYWRVGVRGLALFWYVVAGLAVPVVLTQLSPSL
jgi:heme/copper-type cytochrome/quinol oxidase subunit 3